MFMIIVFGVICLNLCVNKEFVHTYSLPESVSLLKNISTILHSFHFPLIENQFKAELWQYLQQEPEQRHRPLQIKWPVLIVPKVVLKWEKAFCFPASLNVFGQLLKRRNSVWRHWRPLATRPHAPADFCWSLHLKRSHFTQFCSSLSYLGLSFFFLPHCMCKYPSTCTCPPSSYRKGSAKAPFSHFPSGFLGIFLQENGNQVLGNYKLIVFPSKRHREEQAKCPMSGAAFTATHAQSSTSRSDTPGLGVFAKPIPKHTSWAIHPQTHIMGSPSHNHLLHHVPPMLFTCQWSARSKLSFSCCIHAFTFKCCSP